MKIFGYLKPELLQLAAEYEYPVASEIYQFLSSKFDTYSWPWYHEFKELPLASQLRFFDLFSSYLTEVVENSRERKQS